MLFTTYFVVAQEPQFGDFVSGSALPGEGQVTFYIENLSSCVLEEIQIRVAPNKKFNATEGTTFITKLAPKAQGTFVMRLQQNVTDMGWTIDALTLAQPQDNPTCPQAGLIAFKQATFGDAPPPAAQVAQPTPEINRAVTRDYTVVAGDSWWGIAQRFGTTPDVMKQLNNRSDTNLNVGEILKVPAPAAPPPLEQTAAQTEVATSGSVAAGGAPTAENRFTVYTVKAGDTLFGIAQGFNTKVDLIRQANCLGEDAVLSVNQTLQVPPGDAVLTNVCN